MTGSDRSSMASAKLNIAQVAPMPIASEPIATVVNTGSLRQYCSLFGADHRILWSVWEGLRPAKFHEKAARTGSSLRRMFVFRCAFVFFDFGWFFDPAALAARQTTQYDRLPHEDAS
jgi:hypothetical protein